MNSAVDQFRDEILSSGLTPPAEITPGVWHRFPGRDKSQGNRAAYCYFFDHMKGGVYGDFSTGLQSNWRVGRSDPQTEEERHSQQLLMERKRLEYEAEKTQRNETAAAEAERRWHAAKPCTGNAYLTDKCVQPHGTRVEADGALIVPMRDTAGKLWNIERINPADFKDKRGLPGGRRTGCYFGIGKPDDVLIVAEGFATGASIHECTGKAVAVAFNAGNLEAVATALHNKYPALTIIVAADDDHQTEGNPGLAKATAAAKAVGGLLAVPKLSTTLKEAKATDFNDLHQLAGAEAVRACFEVAKPVEMTVDSAMRDDDTWPEPTPLPNALPPVQSFDADLLPVALRGWVVDISYRMQCPTDFPAVAMLVAISSLIGARAVVQPKARDDWRVTPNLWGMTVGRPGVKKSPAFSEALKPLNQLQTTELEQWQLAHDAWALDCKVAELATAGRENEAKKVAATDRDKARELLTPDVNPDEPIARRYIVNDATVEKLGELLSQNPWGTLTYRDELYGLLTSLDKPGQEGSRTFYLQAYDGNQSYTFDRIGRGTLHIPRVCLAMIGGIQPGRIQEYVRGAVAGGSADDGLLQRFGLTVWPDISSEFVHVDQWPDTPAKMAACAVFDRLAGLEPASDDEPTVWRFDSDAQALFVEWLVPFEQELRSDELHPAVVSHLAKYRKLIPALALVFALIDTPDNDGVIGKSELIRALAWCDYLRTHANRLYAAAVVPETTGAAKLLAKIKMGKLVDRDGVIKHEFTPREVTQKNWTGLNDPEAVRKAADLLTAYDYLRREVKPTGSGGGRPSERYLIHPSLLTGGRTA